MFFYELHEGDEDLFADLILAREDEMPPDIFFETVQQIRRRIQDMFEEDTLIEAIAEELERDHGFIFVSDRRLTAAVNVSPDEGENFLTDLEGVHEDDEGDEEEDEIEFDGADYRAVIGELRFGDPHRND